MKIIAAHLKEKNLQTGQELDRIFALRKQKEAETNEIEGRDILCYCSI